MRSDIADGLCDGESGFGETTAEAEARIENAAPAIPCRPLLATTAPTPKGANTKQAPKPKPKNTRDPAGQAAPAVVPVLPRPPVEAVVVGNGAAQPSSHDGVPDNWDDDDTPVVDKVLKCFSKQVAAQASIVDVGSAGKLRHYGCTHVHCMNPIITTSDIVKEGFKPFATKVADYKGSTKFTTCAHQLGDCDCVERDGRTLVFNQSLYHMTEDDLLSCASGTRIMALVDLGTGKQGTRVATKGGKQVAVTATGRTWENEDPSWVTSRRQLGFEKAYVPDVVLQEGNRVYLRAMIVDSIVEKKPLVFFPPVPPPPPECGCWGLLKAWFKRTVPFAWDSPQLDPDRVLQVMEEKYGDPQRPDEVDEDTWLEATRLAERALHRDDMTDKDFVNHTMIQAANTLQRRFKLTARVATQLTQAALVETRRNQLLVAKQAAEDHNPRFALEHEDFKSPREWDKLMLATLCLTVGAAAKITAATVAGLGSGLVMGVCAHVLLGVGAVGLGLWVLARMSCCVQSVWCRYQRSNYHRQETGW